MENREQYWEKLYSRNSEKVKSDIWLDNYLHFFNEKDDIIEFGCGEGYLSEFLLRKGYRVLSTDISLSALEKLKSRVAFAETMKIDVMKPLPFKDSSFNIIIADLCLHYFSEKDTKSILQEYRRILKSGGMIFARVNADSDFNHGAGEGIEIEKGFFRQDGHYKRFFNREMVYNFFADWKDLSASENETDHYIKNKFVYEITAVN